MTTDKMTTSDLELALKLVRAALAEAGVDPSLAYINGHVVTYTPGTIDNDLAWRAAVAVAQAHGALPCCRACFMESRVTGPGDLPFMQTCEADSMFQEDCGRTR